MNQFANLADEVGANIDDVRKIMQSDPRIGNKFLYPGIGYGGSCFPKDVNGVMYFAKNHGVNLSILDAVDKVNKNQPFILVKKIRQYFGEDLNGKRFAVWGLSFKKDTNDVRESPAIPIIKELVKAGALLSVYDPEAMNDAKRSLPSTIKFATTRGEALEGNEALLILTDWDEFKQPDFVELLKCGIKVIFDGKNLLDLDEVKESGLKYFGVGRK
jgi:UDPglucose 6-dehydrogenase